MRSKEIIKDDIKHKRNKSSKMSLMPKDKDKKMNINNFNDSNTNDKIFLEDTQENFDYSTLLMDIITMHKEKKVNVTGNGFGSENKPNLVSSANVTPTNNLKLKKNLTKKIMAAVGAAVGAGKGAGVTAGVVESKSVNASPVVSVLSNPGTINTKAFKYGEVSLTKQSTKKQLSVDVDLYATNSKVVRSVVLKPGSNNNLRNSLQMQMQMQMQIKNKEIKLEFEENIIQKAEKVAKSNIHAKTIINSISSPSSDNINYLLLTRNSNPNKFENKSRTPSQNVESNLNLFKRSTVNKSKNSHSSNSSINISKNNNSVNIKVEARNSVSKEINAVSVDIKEGKLEKVKEKVKEKVIEKLPEKVNVLAQEKENKINKINNISNEKVLSSNNSNMNSNTNLGKSKSKPLMKKVDIKKYFSNNEKTSTTNLKKVDSKLEKGKNANFTQNANITQNSKNAKNANSNTFNNRIANTIISNELPEDKNIIMQQLGIDRSQSFKTFTGHNSMADNKSNNCFTANNRKKRFLNNPFIVPTVKTNLYEDDETESENRSAEGHNSMTSMMMNNTNNSLNMNMNANTVVKNRRTVNNILKSSDSFFDQASSDDCAGNNYNSNLTNLTNCSNRSNRGNKNKRLKEAREKRFMEKQRSEVLTEEETEKPRDRSNYNTNENVDLDRLTDKLNSICMNLNTVKKIREDTSLSPAPTEGKLINRIRSRIRFDSYNSNI